MHSIYFHNGPALTFLTISFWLFLTALTLFDYFSKKNMKLIVKNVIAELFVGFYWKHEIMAGDVINMASYFWAG